MHTSSRWMFGYNQNSNLSIVNHYHPIWECSREPALRIYLQFIYEFLWSNDWRYWIILYLLPEFMMRIESFILYLLYIYSIQPLTLIVQLVTPPQFPRLDKSHPQSRGWTWVGCEWPCNCARVYTPPKSSISWWILLMLQKSGKKNTWDVSKLCK